MQNRADLPGLRSISTITTRNPLWYIAAVVAGIIGLSMAFRQIAAGMNLASGLVLFVVLPIGLPLAVVGFFTWYTDWQTGEHGISRTRLNYGRTLKWSEVDSARLLAKGRTELIVGTQRTVVPGGDTTLTASVWQYLREKKGFELPEAIAPLWDPLPDELPEQMTWTNRHKIGFMNAWGWQVLAIAMLLLLMSHEILRHRKDEADPITTFLPWVWLFLYRVPLAGLASSQHNCRAGWGKD